MYTTEFIANGDIQTAYHDLGNGIPLLMVHGFTGSKLDFADQIAGFVEDYQVLTYDHRGHGESSNLGPYSLAQLVHDLVGLLDALDIPTCHLLGHSLGGMVAARALLAHPTRFRSLVLMDTAPSGVALFSDDIRQRLNDLVLSAGCQGLLPGMQTQKQSPVIQRGIDFLGEAEHWRRIRVKLEQMDPDAFVELGAELENQDSVLDQLHAISVPTTIIVGAHDTPFVDPSRSMHRTITDSKLVTIPNAGHSPQYENADVWRDAVLRHLAEA